jgi:hypothetical protein
VPVQNVLNFDGEDVLATGNNHVLRAVLNADVPIRLDHREAPFFVWNACSNWDWLMLPERLVSMESNRFDIFCCGDAPVLAPETA